MCRYAHRIRVNLPLLYEQEGICFRLYFPLSYAPGCCFVIKKKKGDAGLEACSLWEPFGTGRPIFCLQENVLFFGCLFWLMSAPAKHLHLSFYPSFYHPHTLFRPFQILIYSLLHRILCRQPMSRDQTGVGMLSQLVFDSEDAPWFCRRSTFC